MKQTHQYDYEETPEEARAEAINDIKEYLGGEHNKAWKYLVATTKAGCTFEDLAIACSFAGIEGYPVRAFYFANSPNEDRLELSV